MNAFQQAKTLFPNLSKDESQIKWHVAWALMDQGRNAAQAGKITDALADYDKAQEIGATLKITAENWDTLCWYGSLWGHAAEVISACEQAVSLEPENGAWHHSRGVARGIVGDFKGAIEDLRFFVQW